MTELSWPSVPAGDPPVYPAGGAPLDIARWREMRADDTGVVGSPGGTARQVFVDGAGMQAKRRPGAVFVQGIYGRDDDEKTLTVGANGSGNWRIDRVVDRLSVDGVISTVVKEGTPSATPAAPALTQTPGGVWEESLAQFLVKPGAVSVTTSDAQVVDERRFMPRRNTPVASEALRPSQPRVGDEVDFPDGKRQRWDGTAWVTVMLPEVSFAPVVRAVSTGGATWNTSVSGTGGSFTVDRAWVDGTSVSINADNGPSFATSHAQFITPPLAPRAGWFGSLGSFAYTNETGDLVVAGEIVFGFFGAYGRLQPAMTATFGTSYLRRLMCNWHYPSA